MHLCLGAPLARLEMAVTLSRFAQRLPAYERDPAAEPGWKLRGDRRGLRPLPVIVPSAS